MSVKSTIADVVAFGVLVAEIFTGNIQFEEQKNEGLCSTSRKGKLEIPGNTQAVELTGETESCWQQDPETRPTMEDISRRWQESVVYDHDDKTVTPRCVLLK